jgi:hypothetical protein
MNARLLIRNIFMILAGTAGLLIKRWVSGSLSGSLSELAYSYLGNLAVSFAVYFLVSNFNVSILPRGRMNRVTIAVIALVVVEGFELTNGFGVMTNVYDPFDYLANALGVALAYLVDVVSARLIPADPASS